MSEYSKYNFRAPDKNTFLSDIETVCQDNNIDPYERGILERDENGNRKEGGGIDVIESASGGSKNRSGTIQQPLRRKRRRVS